MTRFTYLLPCFMLLAACSGNSSEEKVASSAATADTLKPVVTDCAGLHKKALYEDSLILSATAMNKALAAQAMEAFETYAKTCLDSLAPVYLQKAGQIAQSVMDLSKAKVYFQTCIDSFPAYKGRGASMFLLAQLYDEPAMLNNEAEAKRLYEKIIKEYPKTAWAENAKAAMANLGKSDEELIKEFMKKNKHS